MALLVCLCQVLGSHKKLDYCFLGEWSGIK
jgi:hypothetical protein